MLLAAVLYVLLCLNALKISVYACICVVSIMYAL